MIESIHGVTDADLDTYVDDQLDASRGIEVEAYLSSNPDVAARVMSDLRTRDELRLALAGLRGAPGPATNQAARRLERGLARGRLLGGLQRAAAVGAFVAIGWVAHAGFGPMLVTQVVASTPPPRYVQDALMAHRTAIVRATMASQPEVPNYDPDDIRAATAIVMPTLPADWRVTDVQLFPSSFGPSVEIVIESEDFGVLSLFAVRPGAFDVIQPTALDVHDATAAYFQIGEVAYVLVTKAEARGLDRSASRLAETLY